ncbi:hypothetical protein [Methyloceanibacter sp.]|uniref:hypothetical protein n=1 Tax=Methyloceanibacter sp. TaxID=1965321 RepID=UPI002D1FAEBB|nr:hypothetical protein [Methyloceanibacter sp.]
MNESVHSRTAWRAGVAENASAFIYNLPQHHLARAFRYEVGHVFVLIYARTWTTLSGERRLLV